MKDEFLKLSAELEEAPFIRYFSILRFSGLSQGEQMIVSYILSFQLEGKPCYPNQETVANACNLTVGSTKTLISKLGPKEKGMKLIKTVNTKKFNRKTRSGGSSSTYEIDMVLLNSMITSNVEYQQELAYVKGEEIPVEQNTSLVEEVPATQPQPDKPDSKAEMAAGFAQAFAHDPSLLQEREVPAEYNRSLTPEEEAILAEGRDGDDEIESEEDTDYTEDYTYTKPWERFENRTPTPEEVETFHKRQWIWMEVIEGVEIKYSSIQDAYDSNTKTIRHKDFSPLSIMKELEGVEHDVHGKYKFRYEPIYA